MKEQVSRRDFMKLSSAATTFLVAQGFSPFSYAQNSKVAVACIGTGGQGCFHLQTGLAGNSDALEIVAIADCYRPHQRAGVKYATDANKGKEPTAYFDYRKMLESEKVDAVVIATPLDTHYQIAMDCLDAGKYVFCEKTMCYDIEQARNIVTKCHEKGLFCQTGHQRRYNPNYNLAMTWARDPANSRIGRITHIDMQWHRNTNWRRAVDPNYVLSPEEAEFIHDLEKHLNWRIYRERSGGLCTELLTHQIDIAVWFLGTFPKRVYGSGGLDYWRDGRTVEDNISLTFDFEIKPGSEGFRAIDARSSFQKVNLINKSYTVRVSYTSIMMNAKRGATELIQGDAGAVELSEHDCWYTQEEDAAIYQARKEAWLAQVRQQQEQQGGQTQEKPAENSAETTAALVTSGGTLQLSNIPKIEAEPLKAPGCDIPADVHQFRAFAHHIRNGGKPRNNEMVGLANTISSVAALQAIRERRIVEIDPAWYTFDFPTPSVTEYETITV